MLVRPIHYIVKTSVARLALVKMGIEIVGLVLGLVGKVCAAAGKGAGNWLAGAGAGKCGSDMSSAVNLLA